MKWLVTLKLRDIAIFVDAPGEEAARQEAWLWAQGELYSLEYDEAVECAIVEEVPKERVPCSLCGGANTVLLEGRVWACGDCLTTFVSCS